MVRSIWIRALVVGVACTIPAWGQAVSSERFVMVREGSKPAQKCRVLKVWTQGSDRLAQVQALDTGEVMTILEQGGRSRTASSRLFRWGSSGSPPAGVPAPPPDARAMARMATETTAVPGQPRPVIKAAVTTAQPGDWRQSWGQVERWTADDSRRAVAQTSARVEKPARPKPPLARPLADDPLRQPERYTRIADDSLPTDAPVAMVPTEAPVRGSLLGWLTGSGKSRPAPVAAPVAAPVTPVPGMASVHAVHSPQLHDPAAPAGASRPGPAMPPAPMMAATSVPANAPNAFTPMVPPAGTMVAQAGVPSGMGNAWTMAHSHRPVPAEMGLVAVRPHNAFQHSGMGGAAARPPVPPQLAEPPGPPAMMASYGPAADAEQAGRLVAVLRDSLLPSEREMVAEQLSRRDWRAEPEVVNALVLAARSDPAPMVRAGCVRALGAMKANSVPVVQAVQELKADGDPRVRAAAEQTLVVLTAP